MFKFENIIIPIISILLMVFIVTAQPQHNNQKAIERAIQDRAARLKFLSEVSFDQAILYALIAIEQNYKVRERLFPKVHGDDYFTLILNTAKRLAMADSGRVTLPGLQKATKQDSTKNIKEKETK